jgi:hypothetical protein
VIVAVSNTAIFAVAAAIIVVAILAQYIMPRRGRRKRPPRA